MLSTLKPNPKKALFFAKKQLSELVFDTVNLEGINYTLPEVQTLIDGVTVGGHRQIDEIITLNQAKAWQFLFAAVEDNTFNISVDFVGQLHRLVTKKEAVEAGQFRSGSVTISGTEYLPPDAGKLTCLWQTLTDKPIPSKTDDTCQFAISLFLQMARAQFFYDGNKRTGRMMMNGILLSKGLPVINLLAKRQLEFNQLMLDFYSTGDEQPMQDFVLSCLNVLHIKIMSE